MFIEIQYPNEKQMMGVVDTIGKKVNRRFSTRHTGELYKHVSITIIIIIIYIKLLPSSLTEPTYLLY